MPPAELWIPGLAIATAVVFGSGIALTRAGRPYGTALLNVHKLVDLAAVVAVAVIVYRAARAGSLSGGEWAVVAATGALFVALFATGAVASAATKPPTWVMRAHRIAPLFGLALAASTVALTLAA